MRLLTKEQLTEFVDETMVNIYRANIKKLTDDMADSVKDTDDPSIAVVKAMALYGTEIIRECNQALIETLYHVLYAE